MNVPGLSKALDAFSARQKAIAENMANVSTPGYQAKDVDFDQALRTESASASLKGLRTDERHLPVGEGDSTEAPGLILDNSPELTSGENNVDVDQEMAKSAENQLYYMATSKLTAGKFKALQVVIRGRG